MSSTIFFFIFIVALAIILLSLNIFLATHNPYSEKDSSFECGFAGFLYQNRTQFSISFFLFALLFLVFDLEIILIYPYVVSAYANSVYGLFVVLIFLVILTAGFVFEIGKGALKINSKQSNNLNSISIPPVASPSSPFASSKGFNKKLNLNQRRTYSTLNKDCQKNLDPNWVTGFSDGDSTFTVSIYNRGDLTRTGWGVQISFAIELHRKDIALLERIQSFFGVGYISVRTNRNNVMYKVNSLQDLTTKIIPHFEQYPLLTQKRADFELFKLIVTLMSSKEHLNLEGIIKILSIRASMNIGLSSELKAAFPNIIPVSRPCVKLPENINLNWLAGFTDAEGCFLVDVRKCLSHKSGVQVSLAYSISQHSRDTLLFKTIQNFLGSGRLSIRPNVVELSIKKFSDLDLIIIPLFDKYPIQGAKALDYADFCKVAALMKVNYHKTKEGLAQIREIKSGMNTKRKYS